MVDRVVNPEEYLVSLVMESGTQKSDVPPDMSVVPSWDPPWGELGVLLSSSSPQETQTTHHAAITKNDSHLNKFFFMIFY